VVSCCAEATPIVSLVGLLYDPSSGGEPCGEDDIGSLSMSRLLAGFSALSSAEAAFSAGP
jgi:hypothetical protein